MHFVDEVEIQIASGRGGNGCISFRREKYVPHGGPNGGDGGKGGDVIIRASPSRTSLYPLTGSNRWRADDGQHGQGSDMTGRGGETLVIEVPVGTLVREGVRGNLLRDLAEAGDEVCVARGGRGGRGNARFASSTDQTPRHAEEGEPGESRTLKLELRLIADVGLVGLPNAGKSTLLSRVSAARPRIADYPFTTLEPMLGLVDAGGYRTFVVADLPGLVEGAHEGVGLGDRFLRHVERTRLLLHVVDAAPIDGSDPVESYRLIRNELACHSLRLDRRPEIIALNKLDVLGWDGRSKELPEAARECLDAMREAAPKSQIHVISAVTGAGVPQLIEALAQALDSDPSQAAADDDESWPEATR